MNRHFLVKLALTAFNKIIHIGKIDTTLLLDAAHIIYVNWDIGLDNSKVGSNVTVLQLAKLVP